MIYSLPSVYSWLNRSVLHQSSSPLQSPFPSSQAGLESCFISILRAKGIGAGRRLPFLLQNCLGGWCFVSMTLGFWWWSHFWVPSDLLIWRGFSCMILPSHCYFLILLFIPTRNKHCNPLESRQFDHSRPQSFAGLSIWTRMHYIPCLPMGW